MQMQAADHAPLADIEHGVRNALRAWGQRGAPGLSERQGAYSPQAWVVAPTQEPRLASPARLLCFGCQPLGYCTQRIGRPRVPAASGLRQPFGAYDDSALRLRPGSHNRNDRPSMSFPRRGKRRSSHQGRQGHRLSLPDSTWGGGAAGKVSGEPHSWCARVWPTPPGEPWHHTPMGVAGCRSCWCRDG